MENEQYRTLTAVELWEKYLEQKRAEELGLTAVVDHGNRTERQA